MVHPNRTRSLNNAQYSKGTITYWMSRDHRVHDNWALLFAQELAQKHQTTLSVVFCLRKTFEFATERLLNFMLTGLMEVEESLHTKNIPFYMVVGDPEREIPKFLKRQKSGAIVTDFSPLRYKRHWKTTICKNIDIPFYEVDAHNIVPVWTASDKQEYGAYTLRPKIHRLLPEFLHHFPPVISQSNTEESINVDWKTVEASIKTDLSVKKVGWITSGEKAALNALDTFITSGISKYDEERNDPTKSGQSGLSPYIHFGQVSTQTIALSLEKIQGQSKSKAAFLEELIIRKELSDNFCFYNPQYDTPDCFPDWAKKTHEKHRDDNREYSYTLEELEHAKTHDELWNAAQKEMLTMGKMHGYMRMYWAKKILEWTDSPETAQRYAIYLNDKYFLDGRDPNGYAGIAWSIGGVHDRAWFERPVFGQIRYMNYNGAKSKFDVDRYIRSLE